MYSTLRILQDFIGCDKFLDLNDPGVLQNCDSLEFVEELDYLAVENDDDDLDIVEFGDKDSAISDLPFLKYSTILRVTSCEKLEYRELVKLVEQKKDQSLACIESFLKLLVQRKLMTNLS